MREDELQGGNTGDGNAWRDIDQPSGSSDPAIYEMRLVDEDGIPIPLGRFLNVDADGIISIGLTTSMEQRRQQFVCGVVNCYGHSEGNLLNLLRRFSRLQDVFPNAKCQYRFASAAEVDLAARERSAIKRYVRRFGEVPPLNSAIPGRYDIPSWQEELAGNTAEARSQIKSSSESSEPNEAC